jgi:methylmalonyl-CoA/ethylmalonyl-CoA epimerase
MSTHMPAGLELPPLVQIGFVVGNLAEAMLKYERLYGPWQRFDGSVPGATYRGRSADVRLDIAIGHSGSLEIELIQWLSGDSPHREFIERGREGMHHVQYRVEDADAWIAKLAPLGYEPIWYKRWCADTTFAYLERAGDPLIVEFLQMPAGGPNTSGVQ